MREFKISDILKVCSLFTQIGGVDFGFEQARFNVVWTNEIDEAACKTYHYNNKNASLIKEDIHKMNPADIPQIRKCTFIIAFQNIERCDRFEYPSKVELTTRANDFIDRNKKQNDIYYYGVDSSFYSRFNKQVYDKDSIYKVTDGEVHKVRNQQCPTLMANMGSYPNRVPVIKNDYGLRKLTLRECLDF